MTRESTLPANLGSSRINLSRSIILIAHFFLAAAVSNAAQPDQSMHHENDTGVKPADHGQHRNMMKHKTGYRLSTINYALPDTRLVGSDGKVTSLGKVLDYQGGVMMNFIFTSCTTICPTMSVIFSGVNKQLDADSQPVRLVSISIDPEHDTPTRLREYATKFGADRNWHFFTGDLADIVDLQKKLGIYRGNKMNHFPATFIRRDPEDGWLRVDGFTVASDLVREYRKFATRSNLQ